MLTVADTAYSIAAVRAQESALPTGERLFDDPFAAVFHAAGAHAAEGTERFMALPFLRDSIRLRTRFIDDAVREGVRDGLTQVVLLGAGFDARALRLPELADGAVAVYEVDFAALLEHKRALLAAAGVTLPASVRYVPCDFDAPEFDRALTAELARQGFRVGEGALFVWEGVIGYIDDAAIDRSLAFMARAGGPGTRVVMLYTGASFEPDTALERALRLGFTGCDETAFDAVWRRYLPGEPHENAWFMRMGVARV